MQPLAVAATLAALVWTTGCSSCPPEFQLDTPEHTLATFRGAFECNKTEMEYRCFSDGVKSSFGGLAGYEIGSAIFKAENGPLLFLLKWGPEGPAPVIKYIGDGSRARATFDTLPGDAFGQAFTVELVNEPEYWLYYANGEVTNGYADAVTVVRDGKDIVRFTLRDADLGKPLPNPIQRGEIRSRWVIDGIPGLSDAQKKAHEPQP